MSNSGFLPCKSRRDLCGVALRALDLGPGKPGFRSFAMKLSGSLAVSNHLGLLGWDGGCKMKGESCMLLREKAG